MQIKMCLFIILVFFLHIIIALCGTSVTLGKLGALGKVNRIERGNCETSGVQQQK